MKTLSFKNKYSKYYDIMYSAEKDYSSECNFLVRVFEKFSSTPTENILDIACGTGRHAIELVKRGYKVEGADLSRDMIRIAQENAKKSKVKIDYNISPMQEFRSFKQFDAAICMFAAFDYLTDSKDVKKAVNNFSKLIKPGGLFIMDFWNEKMFKDNFERFRVKDICSGGYRILRISDSELLEKENCLNMKIKCLVFRGKKLVEEFTEEHKMRYWDQLELKHLFESCGFKIIKICPFMDLDKKQKNDWVLNLIAKRQ